MNRTESSSDTFENIHMQRRAEVLHRFLIPFSDLENLLKILEPTNDPIWVKKEKLQRYTARGIPAKRLDFAVTSERKWQGKPHELYLVEICNKMGKFDGEIRRRIAVRIPLGGWLLGLPVGHLGYGGVNDLTFYANAPTEGQHEAVKWVETFECLRSSANYDDLGSVIFWHWTRYYQIPVSYDQAKALAESFEASHPELRERGASLAEVNRAASRDLYAVATAGGWKKLTIKERNKLGLTGQWHKEEKILSLRNGTTSGCGQYTIESADNGQCVPTFTRRRSARSAIDEESK